MQHLKYCSFRLTKRKKNMTCLDMLRSRYVLSVLACLNAIFHGNGTYLCGGHVDTKGLHCTSLQMRMGVEIYRGISDPLRRGVENYDICDGQCAWESGKSEVQFACEHRSRDIQGYI